MTAINVKYNYWILIAGELLGSKSLQVPADFIAVSLWAITGLIATALIAIFGPSTDLAGILAAAE